MAVQILDFGFWMFVMQQKHISLLVLPIMLKVGTFSGHNTDLIQIAATLSVKVPGYPYIKYALPKWIIWLLALLGKLTWIIPKA